MIQNPPIRAVVFDFDGLILDTELPEVRAWQHVFDQHGCKFPDSWWMDAIGRGADQIVQSPFEILEELAVVPVDPHEVDQVRREVYERIMGEQDALPGVRELVKSCRKSGVRTAVASSSKHEWVDGYLDHLEMLTDFDAILCADDVARAKPFPDLYLAACDALDTKPHEAIAFEDSPNGIKAAKAAGLFCVAVPNTLTSQLDLSEADLRLATLQGVCLQDLIRLRD